MRTTLIILCFFLWVPAATQSGERWFFTFGPSVSLAPSFEGGRNSISAPDITGSHHIQAMFSPLWGFPNPQYSGFQNLGRKIHMGLQYERFLNPKFAVVSGMEVGARGYIIKSDFSNDLLVSYRTVSVPLYACFSPFPGQFWAFRQHLGTKFIYASSITEKVDRNIEIHQKRTLTPQLYAGLELIHHGFSAPFSFELGYTHGFINLISHGYLGLDYVNPVPIVSKGSALSLTVKYLLYERKKEPKPRPDSKVIPDIYDELAYRKVKDAVPVQVSSDSIRLCVFDDQTVDGDSIAIEFNQRLIEKAVRIQRAPYCFDIQLSKGGSNTLIVHALNEGRIPPNTCVMSVTCGDMSMEVRLKSDMEFSGAIQFYR